MREAEKMTEHMRPLGAMQGPISSTFIEQGLKDMNQNTSATPRHSPGAPGVHLGVKVPQGLF